MTTGIDAMATPSSSPDTLLILGAGYTGKELTRQALHSDYRIIATSRDDDTLQWLEQQGAVAVRWSVGDDPQLWARYLGESTALVYSIPTLFRDYQPATNGTLPRHIQPVDEVIELCRQEKVSRFIYLSSSSVYGDHGGEWIDETADLAPTSPVGKMRADIEHFLLDQNVDFPINIARLVGIYGPGRTLLKYIQSGRYTLVDDGSRVSNRIHVHDIARAILTLVERGPDEHRVFNFTDGHPQPSRDLVNFVCHKADIDLPPEESLEEYARRRNDPNAIARRKNSVRLLNDRLRNELNFSLVYPDVFAGYDAIFEQRDRP